jgi:hypothetical protein
MGETDGIPGAWSYVEGGMGALSRAIASAAADEGYGVITTEFIHHTVSLICAPTRFLLHCRVTIVTDAAVKSIIVSGTHAHACLLSYVRLIREFFFRARSQRRGADGWHQAGKRFGHLQHNARGHIPLATLSRRAGSATERFQVRPQLIVGSLRII